MSEEDVTLFDLLNLSIGTPQQGAVNFSALHALLHAVLSQLGIRELRVRWTGELHTEEVPLRVDTEGDTEPASPSPAASVPSPCNATPDSRSRIQACEDGLSEAMRLIEELHNQKDNLKDEIKELQCLQRTIASQAEMVTAVETSCHCVDDLEAILRPIRETIERYPDPEELRHCVTWDMMQLALLSEKEETESADGPATWKWSNLEAYSETVQVLRNVGKLREKFDRLEACVAALEAGKVDHTQLTQLRQAITNKGSQDVSKNLMDQLNQQRALTGSLMSDREKSAELLDNVQRALLQLQAELEKMQEMSRCLHEDSQQKQNHIEELYKMMDKVEEKKADKQMVETEIKADKFALDSKVSRLQFDSATEQLNSMFHELLNKVTGQEQDWHKIVDKLSNEMECKLNRIELDSVKKQLEDRWRNIYKKLQTQGAPEYEDAAGIRKQLVERFHCLSCDRPIHKQTPGPHLVTLPSSPAFPSHKSMRPFTIYALEQFRQHYRSDRFTDLTDYGHLSMSRSCGGSHTVTSANQRRTGLQSMKNHILPEGDALIQSEEVDILGLDGHIYRGRLNPPAFRNTETKLPTISSKDEVGHNAPIHLPYGAKRAQCSRSASSSSGQDWPGSALGCMSQSSMAPTSAAAERSAESHENLSDIL